MELGSISKSELKHPSVKGRGDVIWHVVKQQHHHKEPVCLADNLNSRITGFNLITKYKKL